MRTAVRVLIVTPGRCHQGPRGFSKNHLGQSFAPSFQCCPSLSQKSSNIGYTSKVWSVNPYSHCVTNGLGTTLFVNLSGKRHIAQFFQLQIEGTSTQLLSMWTGGSCNSQTGAEHFVAYICESIHPLKVLSESKPCVQAYNRLHHGHFSASARVSTFLLTLSSYNVMLLFNTSLGKKMLQVTLCNPQSCCQDSFMKLSNLLLVSFQRQMLCLALLGCFFSTRLPGVLLNTIAMIYAECSLIWSPALDHLIK